MTVYIKRVAEGSRYNWRVQVGTGRGSVIKSRHQFKRRAKEAGRRLAKERNDVLKEQMQAGYWQTVRSY
jgi:hypothetical protein